MNSSLLFHITLKDIRPAQNRQRVYTIAVSSDGLFDSYAITLYWGRVGSKRQRKICQCNSKKALDKLITGILKVRLKHGYLLVDKHEFTPEYSILEEFEMAPIYPSNQLKLFT